MREFKAGDVVKRVSGGANLGVRVGDTRTVKSVNGRGWLVLGGDFERYAHDPSRYELVEEVDDSTAESLRGIAEFCLGEGAEYDRLDVMQYLEECERWRIEANSFRYDAHTLLHGAPSSGPGLRTASREVYDEVLDALKDLSTLKDRCDELRELEEDLTLSLDDSEAQHQRLVDDLREALAGEVGKAASVEDMLGVVRKLTSGTEELSKAQNRHMDLIFDLQEALGVGPDVAVGYMLRCVKTRSAVAQRAVQKITKPEFQYARDERQYDRVVTIKVSGNAKVEVE